MAHAQKPDLGFRQNGQVHLNRRGRQFSRLLAAEMCISSSNAGCTVFQGSVRVLATRSIRQCPLPFPSRASPCAVRFQLDSTCSTRSGENLCRCEDNGRRFCDASSLWTYSIHLCIPKRSLFHVVLVIRLLMLYCWNSQHGL